MGKRIKKKEKTKKGCKMNSIKEIKQFQATDGTCFDTWDEAVQYEEMLQNPHFKKLQERIEKLEADLSALRIEVSTKTWFQDVRINRPPYQQPISYTAYNPATKQAEQKDVK